MSNKLPTTTGVVTLTRDAEVRTTTEKSKLIEISGAANAQEKIDGKWTPRVSYFTIKVWLPKESKLTDFLVKGQAIQFSGDTYQERWEKDGKKGEKIVINCTQNGVGLVGGSKAGAGTSTGAGDDLPPEVDINEDEIPF